MKPYYADESLALYEGDALTTLLELPAASVDCIVTSPPYFGLRDYGVEGQQGLEDSPAEYVDGMVAVFSEARRVLADDVQSGCKTGGVVLDPYSGSGTTGLAAARHGRRYVGIDLNRDYLDLSLRTRLAQAALIEDGGAA